MLLTKHETALIQRLGAKSSEYLTKVLPARHEYREQRQFEISKAIERNKQQRQKEGSNVS